MSEKPKIQKFNVDDFSFGEKEKTDIILFATLQELEGARKEIDNGNDVYIEKEGIATLIPHQMISAKVYDGRLKLSARRDAIPTLNQGEAISDHTPPIYERTTEEQEIIDKLDYAKIEEWAKNKEFWRIYCAIIDVTKEYFSKR